MNLDSYKTGGVNYWLAAAKWGIPAANRIAAAAESGDVIQFNLEMSNAARGTTLAPLNDSTWSNFWDQMTNDPLAAPLDSANNQLGNAFANVLKNPWVLIALAVVLFLALGGADFLRRQLAK